MPDAPPELTQAVRVAARRVEKLLLEMLLANQTGEVVIEVGWGQLQPLKRIVERDSAVRVGRGRLAKLGTVE